MVNNFALLPTLLTACATIGPLAPFTTDGCSLFPDGSFISNTSWCHCCVAHDLVYWRGGTAEARLLADRELKACVQKAADNPVVAQSMYAGVRLGGGGSVRGASVSRQTATTFMPE
jgi:hypothetical protein